MNPVDLLATAWCAVAIVCDARTRRLPNTLTFGAAVVSATCFGTLGLGPLGAPWLPSILAGGAVALTAFALFAGGKLGAGDVKFMAVLPLVGGPSRAAVAFAFGSGLLLLWFAALHFPVLAAQLARFSQFSAADVPLGVPFGLGFLVSVWWAP